MASRRVKAAAAPARPTPPDFEFRIQGPAISARSKNRPRLHAWSAQVAAAAQAAWPIYNPPTADDVEVHISEFSESATKDRDNMAKPILDAMQGIVYENDKQVKRLNVEWCNIEGSYTVRYMSPVVAAALSAGKEFLWVRVWRHAPRQDLTQ
jgi:hypothetical protein